MTINEVVREANAYQKRKKQDLQWQAQMCYMVPQLIGQVVGNMFSKQQRPLPAIYDLFPSLFDEEKVEENRIKAETQRSWANFLRFAESKKGAK